MSKTLNDSTINTKCGSVFYHNIRRFTIACNFCEKVFKFERFLLHFQDAHSLENVLETVETINGLDISIKEESSIEKDFSQNLMDPVPNATVVVKQKMRFEYFLQERYCGNNENVSVEEGNCKDDALDIEVKDSKQTASAETHNCNICKKTFKKRPNLRKHERIVHNLYIKPPEKREYSCLDCSMIFRSIRLHDQHCNEKHNGVSCGHCERKFMSSSGREYHLSSNNVNFMCDVDGCGVIVSSQGCLKRHKITHLPPEEKIKYSCSKCYCTFTKPEKLIVHKRKHEGVKKVYPCQVCGKEFFSWTTRSQHAAVHKSKTYTCEICGVSFKRYNTLYHHIKIHDPVKKYKCPECGAAFAQAQGYTRHKRLSKKAGKCIQHLGSNANKSNSSK